MGSVFIFGRNQVVGIIMWFIPRVETESSNRGTCRMKSSGELFPLFVTGVILCNLCLALDVNQSGVYWF